MKQRYSFNGKSRYADVRTYRLLTSRAAVAAFLVTFLLALAAWAAVLAAINPLPINLTGLAVLLTGFLSAQLLIFTFATTYFPNQLPPRRVLDLDKAHTPDAAQAATFDLLLHIGSYAREDTPASVTAAIQHLITADHGRELLGRLELEPESFLHAIQTSLPAFNWAAWAAAMVEAAQSLHQSYLTSDCALLSLLLQPTLKTYLRQHSLTERDILFVLWWQYAAQALTQANRRWWQPENLLAISGVGLSWASGYTPFVDRFARIPRGNVWDQPFGHEEQVDELINSLARARQSNVLVVGHPGVGRYGVIREAIRRIHADQAHPDLTGRRVLYIHVGELLGLTGSAEGQLATVSRALGEMERAGNVIAVLDGLGTILGQSGEERLNLGDVIKPFFDSPNVRTVAIMGTEEYHLRLKANQELMHLFEVVQVEPLSQKETLQLLAVTLPEWEARGQVFLPYKTLRALVEDTATVMPQIPFPEKAFDILEEALAVAERDQAGLLTEEAVDAVISHKIGFNIGKLKASERDHLLRLEEIIHQRVVNQTKGVAAVARAMIRARAGVRSQARPIGTFLFMGPTGVGKTETAKALAEAYFGSEEYMTRLDMSEFHGNEGLTRLIGSAAQPAGRLTSLIADHPFTVLLLDEFEKADREVHQLFLQVFDEGRITDARGQVHSFQHAIIIATSNAGAEFIRQHVTDQGYLPDGFDDQLREHILRQQIFQPELINRFDGVITFVPLTPQHVGEIATLMLRRLNQRLDAEHGITVAITSELVQHLVSVGYDAEFGARPMQRAIQDTVEYAVAQKILRNEVSPGQEVILPIGTLAPLKVR